MHCPSSIYSSIFHLSIFFFLSASLSIPFRHWDIRLMFTVEIPVLKRIFFSMHFLYHSFRSWSPVQSNVPATCCNSLPHHISLIRMKPKAVFTDALGIFLKIVLADRIAISLTGLRDYHTFGGWYLIVATALFAIQIYCDFCRILYYRYGGCPDSRYPVNGKLPVSLSGSFCC